MVYLLGALLDGVEEVHRQPETVCCEIAQSGGRRDYGLRLLGGENALPGEYSHLPDGVGPIGSGGVGLPGDGDHLLFVVLSTNKSLHVEW